MGKRFLIDTNIVAFLLEGRLPDIIKNSLISPSSEVSISVMTRMELLSWPNATKDEQTLIRSFLSEIMIYDLEEEIILKAIEIRKKKRLKLPDAIIAATAISKDMILMTADVSAFKSIKNLRRQIVKL